MTKFYAPLLRIKLQLSELKHCWKHFGRMSVQNSTRSYKEGVVSRPFQADVVHCYILYIYIALALRI